MKIIRPSTAILIATLALCGIACRNKRNTESADLTGLDRDHRYHRAFFGFYRLCQPPFAQDTKEFLIIYHHNGYMQRFDMPSKSMIAYFAFSANNSHGVSKSWIFPETWSFDQVKDAIEKGPDFLDKELCHASFRFSPVADSLPPPQLSPAQAADLYQRTELACSKSKVSKYVLNELSNCEWYAIKHNGTIGAISRHDLERFGQSQLATAIDVLLNRAFTQHSNRPNAGLTIPSTPPASRARTQ